MEPRPSTYSYYDVLMKRDYYDVLDKEIINPKRKKQKKQKKGKRKIGEPATLQNTSQDPDTGQRDKSRPQEMSIKSGDTVHVGTHIQRLHLRRSSSTPDLGRLTQASSKANNNNNNNNKASKAKSTTVTPASPQTSPSSDSVSLSFFSPESTAMKVSTDKKAFQQVVQLWKREGWPVQLLFEDPTSARLLQDNAVFTAISFYGHKWRWDKNRGLMMYVACDGQAQTKSKPNMKLVPWNDIKDRITVINAAGWLVFDGVYYGMNGLEGVEGYGNTDRHSDGYKHMWKWKKVPIAYRYPEDQRPNYSYFEIISCSWEHSGFPGFGLERPHGHVSVEFCDTQGNVYSVGQYPDPRGMGTNKMGTIYLTTLGVLMASDPYLSSRGEKSVHRYNLGTGARGQRNFEKLMAHVENIQRCGVLHNGLDNNCSDFAVSLEHFVLENCEGAALFDLHKERHFLPQREIRPRPPRLTRKGSRKQRLKSSALGIYATLYHYVILFLISIVLSLLSLLPVSTRLGRGRGVDISSIPIEEVVGDTEEEEEEEDTELQEHISKELADMFCSKDEKNFGALRRKWISPLWPRKVRLVQLYGPMRRYSALFIS